jgi:cell division protein FtsB
MGAAVGVKVKQGIVAQQKLPRTWSARISAKFTESRLIVSRRRVGTVAAIVFAALIAYHVVAGNNGLTVYKQKIEEDKALAARRSSRIRPRCDRV